MTTNNTQNVETNTNKHKCDLCDKSYSRDGSLVEHKSLYIRLT